MTRQHPPPLLNPHSANPTPVARPQRGARAISQPVEQSGVAPRDTNSSEPASVASGSGDPLMALSEVAALLQRSPRTLRRWRQLGLLRDVRLGGSVWIRRSDLDRALRAGDAEDRDVATDELAVMGPPRR